jgi:hypothetical protein
MRDGWLTYSALETDEDDATCEIRGTHRTRVGLFPD